MQRIQRCFFTYWLRQAYVLELLAYGEATLYTCTYVVFVHLRASYHVLCMSWYLLTVLTATTEALLFWFTRTLSAWIWCHSQLWKLTFCILVDIIVFYFRFTVTIFASQPIASAAAAEWLFSIQPCCLSVTVLRSLCTQHMDACRHRSPLQMCMNFKFVPGVNMSN